MSCPFLRKNTLRVLENVTYIFPFLSSDSFSFVHSSHIVLVLPFLLVRNIFHIYYIDVPRDNSLCLQNIPKNLPLVQWKRLLDSHDIEDCIIKRKLYILQIKPTVPPAISRLSVYIDSNRIEIS